jgi:hypothetical protein
MATVSELARGSGALSAAALQTGRGGPTPHFDSILRAAPAYDDDDYNEEEDNSNDQVRLQDSNDGPSDFNGTVSQIIAPHIAHHHSLHAYLDANQLLEETVTDVRNRVNEGVGQVRKKEAEVIKAQVGLKNAQAQKGRSSMLWAPKKRKQFKAALDKVSDDIQVGLGRKRRATDAFTNLFTGLVRASSRRGTCAESEERFGA